MFKKLKDKITEEVKSSPQRFQQLTQTVSDKLQGSSARDETMFSIGEDDQNTSMDQGFSSVTLMSPSSDCRSRRQSTSSLASDISFLPRYEAANVYHLQSDLDVSASELEDNASQSSSQLGHVSKEQVFSAFQKSQMRYHKYRGRYTDLARHYQELERENAKMKAILVESQDKAIRRTTELKEQCVLEQKAKAHLESALRDELEEKQLKIDSLETKVGLLQEGQSDTTGSDLVEKEMATFNKLTQDLNDAREEIEALNGQKQEFKASVIVWQSKENEYKERIAAIEKEISSFAEREKENNLKLAENKMELHNELLSKDSEIGRLKHEIDLLKSNASEQESTSRRMENLQTQNKKLIEKLENLTQKCNGLENELLKVEKYKLDIKELNERNSELSRSLEEAQRDKNLVSNMQNTIDKLQDGLMAAHEQLKSLNEEKLNLIATIQQEKSENIKQIENLREIAKKGLSTSLTDILLEKEEAMKEAFEKELSEMRLETIKKDNIIETCLNELRDIRGKLEEKDNEFRELLSNHLELIEACNKLRQSESRTVEAEGQKISELEQEIRKMRDKLKSLQDELEHVEKINEDKEKLNVQLAKDNLAFETSNIELLRKFRLLEEKQETQEMETIENNQLKLRMHDLENQIKMLQDNLEMQQGIYETHTKELEEMKVKEVRIEELNYRNQELEEKVVKLKGYLDNKESKIVELNKLKLSVEKELEANKESLRIHQEREQAVAMDKTECDLLEIRLQQVENERDEYKKLLEMEHETTTRFPEELQSHKEDVMKENMELAKENVILKKANDEMTGKLRLFEEKEQAVALETSECNMLQLKLQEFETREKDLVQFFENEREQFNKILMEHKELKVKNERINDLERSNKHLSEKIAEYKQYLEDRKEKIATLQKEKLSLEQELSKTKEDLQIKEEGMEAVEMAKTEDALSMLKLKSEHEENQELRTSFEIERATYEQALSKGSHIENKIDELTLQNISLNREMNDSKETFKIQKQDLLDLFEVEGKNFQLIDEKFRKLNREEKEKDDLNCSLKKEIDRLKEENSLLRKESGWLQNGDENVGKKIDNQFPGNSLSDSDEPTSRPNENPHRKKKRTQYNSLEATNTRTREFYENELEKIKNQNEKLRRQLDETLVTLHHCAELSSTTEIEYLKNVLYNYMLGKESMVLARVIAAVCKFDPSQTEAVLQKEQQKQTLLGQLGII